VPHYHLEPARRLLAARAVSEAYKFIGRAPIRNENVMVILVVTVTFLYIVNNVQCHNSSGHLCIVNEGAFCYNDIP
jgi:hypothetical protein